MCECGDPGCDGDVARSIGELTAEARARARPRL